MMREIPIEKNDDIEFTIDALGSEGQGIGRVEAVSYTHLRAHET